jgi:hypothetical protein
MLQTLRQYDRKEVERILSSLTSELLPNPEIHVRAELGVDPEIHSRVWNEIQRRVRVDPSDTSPSERGKLFDFLFREMSQGALSKSTVESTKARLSVRGELRPDLYEVKFSPFFTNSQDHGVRPNHVLEAIRNADDVEHLNMFDNEELLSLFLRTQKDFPNQDPFVLLVVARRIEAYLEVSIALRVYLSDVDYSAAQRPLDVLRLLVSKYGYVITIGQVSAKLIVNETIALDGPLSNKNFVKVHAEQGASILGSILRRPRRLHNTHGIALGFALDQVKYAADLRKHGVRVDHENYVAGVFEWELEGRS